MQSQYNDYAMDSHRDVPYQRSDGPVQPQWYAFGRPAAAVFANCVFDGVEMVLRAPAHLPKIAPQAPKFETP